jgi:hypothetical protein
MVEGALHDLRRHTGDRIGHLVEASVVYQVASGNTHYRDAARRKPLVASDIALRPIAHIVSKPVNLDCETCLRTIEIDHVGADRMLAAKARPPRQAHTQARPQTRFRH